MTKKIYEFKINEYLFLRMYDDDGITRIYVSGTPFTQCKFLLLNINVDEISALDEIESIDEAAEKLDASMENEEASYKFKIPPETEFWGHCSNIQVWYEHDYDTRLLRSNLAFPLLRRLTEAGDPLAKKVFVEEIMKRYENGTETTRAFLELEGFLRYLPLDVQLHIALNDDDYDILMELFEILFKNRSYPIMEVLLDYIDLGKIKIESKQVIELNVRNFVLLNSGSDYHSLQEFPKSILKFKFLRTLSLRNNKLKEIPKDIDKLKNLRELWLENNDLQSLPDSICNLKNLEMLWLEKNKLKHLPINIGNLTQLKTLNLRRNQLKNFTLSICQLHKLERLLLSDNSLSELPECLSELKSLTYIDLDRNKFTEYPKILKKMSNLKKIDIDFKKKA